MNVITKLRAMIVLLGATIVTAEASTIIDFESLASSTSEFVYPGALYTEDGYDIRNITVTADRPFASPGSSNATH